MALSGELGAVDLVPEELRGAKEAGLRLFHVAKDARRAERLTSEVYYHSQLLGLIKNAMCDMQGGELCALTASFPASLADRRPEQWCRADETRSAVLMSQTSRA